MKREMPTKLDRTFSIEYRADGNNGDGPIDVSLSSETPVERWFGLEILSHAADAVSFERAKEGLPLLINHDTGKLAGRISNVRLDGKRLRGALEFDADDPEAALWRSKIEKGIARDMSISYAIDEFETLERKDGPDQITVTRWVPLEGSIVAIGADASVGVNRSIQQQDRGKGMDNNDTPTGADDGAVNVTQLRTDLTQSFERGADDGIKREQARQREIRDEFRRLRWHGPEWDALRESCIDSGTTPDQARKAILEQSRTEPGAPIADYTGEDSERRAATAPGKDEGEKFAEGIEAALLVRSGIERDPEKRKAIRQNEFGGMRLIEIARAHLQRGGVSAGRLSPSEVTRAAFKRSGLMGHATTDFTDILANVANKALTLGYTQAPENWRPFCRVVPIADYKPAKRANITSFSDLDRLYEHQSYKEGTTSDLAETLTMRKYGKLFTISHEAIQNDDLDAISRVPMKMGAAAARVVGDLVFTEILLGNVTLGQDSTTLFHADHSNLVAAGSGAAPSVVTLNAGYAAMGTQTDPDARSTLNVMPQFLIVPHALAGTAQVLTAGINQAIDPGATSGFAVVDADNRFRGLTVIAEPRIDANDAAKWFLAANPNNGVIDTIEVAFLDGREEPFMETREGFESDGMQSKIRLEVTAGAIAYQGLYFNDGN